MPKGKNFLANKQRRLETERRELLRTEEARRIAERQATEPQRIAERRETERIRERDTKNAEGMIEEILSLAAALDYPGAELVTLSRRLHPLLLKKTLAGWHLGGTWKRAPKGRTDSETARWVTFSLLCDDVDFYLVEDGRILSMRTHADTSIFNFPHTEKQRYEDGESRDGQLDARYAKAIRANSVRSSSANTVETDVLRFATELRQLLEFMQSL
jgi:hypothetical protein